jgi:hypothetical protein
MYIDFIFSRQYTNRVVFCRSLFVSFDFMLAIEFSILHRLMSSDYSFGIFKLFYLELSVSCLLLIVEIQGFIR